MSDSENQPPPFVLAQRLALVVRELDALMNDYGKMNGFPEFSVAEEESHRELMNELSKAYGHAYRATDFATSVDRAVELRVVLIGELSE